MEFDIFFDKLGVVGFLQLQKTFIFDVSFTGKVLAILEVDGVFTFDFAYLDGFLGAGRDLGYIFSFIQGT